MSNGDTIAVRPDERFDEARLADYLRGRLPGSERPLRVRQFGGGAANLTYLLDYGSDQYVLRRPPLGPVAKSAHDMAREYRVLSVLHQAFPAAPQAHLFCDDPAVIGAEFFVMARREGVVVRRTMPDAFGGVPDAGRRMSTALVDTLADFHAVDFAALGLADLGKPAGFVERQIEGWYRRWQAAKSEEVPEMDAVYDWLRAHVPAATAVSLVHNDYKLDNVMLAADDPGRIVAVFDWDMCTLGDPLNDLGALLTYWTEPTDPPYFRGMAMMPVGAQYGFLTRDELVARYAERSGRSVRDIRFYHTLGLFRLTVIIAQIYIRYARGQTQDKRFAMFGPMIPLMARAARERSV
ncbi:MAG: phosphotransferase family protein [Anaerolineales bacterium]|nr:phosphotransferase family protein [Anaerolineales bacterium]